VRQLTSFSVPLSKRVIPVLFYASMGVAAVLGVLDGELLAHPESALGLILVAAVFYMFQKLLVSDTADEVVDFGSYLLVQRRGAKDRIELRDIVKVDASLNLSPPLMTLHLAKPSKFGSIVTFIPAGGRLNPFGEHPLAKEIVRRAEAARGIS
jgi:hypothetical protein